MDTNFILTNLFLLASSFVSAWIAVKVKTLPGLMLLFAFLSDHAYRLILVYEDGITFTSLGMQAPLYVHVVEVLAVIGRALIPLALWMISIRKL